MCYYAITSEIGLEWTGIAGSATEAMRLLMDDVGADEYTDAYVYSIPEPPAGWEGEGPNGWLADWVDEHGKREHVADQVRIDGRIYDFVAVTALMDGDILEEMDADGEYAYRPIPSWTGALGLAGFVAAYRERHAAKYDGEEFVVN